MSEPTPAPAAALAPADTEVRSSQSPELGPLLAQLGISLVVSTYQAGKVVLLRHEDGAAAMDFIDLRKPMGLAADGPQLAIGVLGEIAFYTDVKSNCAKLEPPGKYDACYVPRYRHLTGEIDIHEMAFDRDGRLWFVNTRFSAICTLHGGTSFELAWRPPFITDWVAEDRCHLNGLALFEGRPRWATAHGESDAPAGWRAHKADGGILLDIAQNGRIVSRGLSMPHSPRWHANQLWLCESGKGALSRVDPATGAVTTFIELPGFTRGLDFHGHYAFVGLSEVRESATFSGIPIADPARERHCGVVVVDLRSARIAGLLKFTAGAHEIFGVQVLPQARCPVVLDKYDPVALKTYFLPPAISRRLAEAETGSTRKASAPPDPG